LPEDCLTEISKKNKEIFLEEAKKWKDFVEDRVQSHYQMEKQIV